MRRKNYIAHTTSTSWLTKTSIQHQSSRSLIWICRSYDVCCSIFTYRHRKFGILLNEIPEKLIPLICEYCVSRKIIGKTDLTRENASTTVRAFSTSFVESIYLILYSRESQLVYMYYCLSWKKSKLSWKFRLGSYLQTEKFEKIQIEWQNEKRKDCSSLWIILAKIT